MDRRVFLQTSVGTVLAAPLLAELKRGQLDAAAAVLAEATATGGVDAAALYVRQNDFEFARSFGVSKSADDIFLLASISKPMSAAALMTLYDRGAFQLDDRVAKFIPEFSGPRRGKITIRQLLTHVSGLPDQLPENEALRRSHAPLSEFTKGAIRTPLLFEPGTTYSYSSMGILVATEIAQRITGKGFHEFIAEAIFEPLGMNRSALGLGKFRLEDLIRCQVGNAAPESGAGNPSAKDWDWNSMYWRKLGVPWGGAHASASDVARFMDEFLHPAGKALKHDTAKMMIENHNRLGLTPRGLTPRGLGFGVGTGAGSPGCSEKTFGHTGATGTLAWADPGSDTICIVLTTLPGRAVDPHPRNEASDRVAQAAI